MARRKLAPGDLLRIREVEDPQISPDGESVAFVRMEMDGKENIYRRSIWIAPVSGGRPRRITHGGGKGDFRPRWSPDGSTIAFTSLRTGKPQLRAIGLRGGESRPLTDLRTGADFAAWSPDSSAVAFVTRVREDEARLVERGRGLAGAKDKQDPDPPPDPRVVERIIYREGTEYKDGRRAHVFAVRPSGRGMPERVSSGDFDHTAPLFSPDGKSVVTTSNRLGDEDWDVVANIVRFPRGGGKPAILTKNRNACESLAFSPDGKRLAYVSYPGEKLYAHNQSACSMPAGGGRETVLSADFDGDAESVGFLASGDPVILACREGRRGLFRLAGGRGPEAIAFSAPWIESFSSSRACDVLAICASSPAHPADLFALAAGSERRLTDLNRGFLSGFALSAPEEIRFRGKGGLPVQGWYMRPQGPSGVSRPLAVEIHGGPHIMWGESFWFEFQMLASNGFGVFFCNPRGSTGYGLKFKGMLFRNWGVDDSADVLRGVALLVRRGLADRRRLFLTGGSYGGFLSAWIAGHDQRFRAAVLQRGVYDMAGFYGCSDVQMLLEWEFETYPWDSPDLMWEHSPLAYVRHMKTPILIEHAENDYRAPINTAEELFIALKKLGREVKMVRYPREGHEMSRSGEPRHRVDRLSRILGWFKDHLP